MTVPADSHTVLICYDGTDRAQHATTLAAALFPGAQAHVVNVWEPIERIIARYAALGTYLGAGIGQADTGMEAESASVAAAGAELAGSLGLHATPHAAQLRTTVCEAVLELAEELDADVIITGTRSLHGVREALANTLSHALLQHSVRPVLAIPTPAPPPRD